VTERGQQNSFPLSCTYVNLYTLLNPNPNLDPLLVYLGVGTLGRSLQMPATILFNINSNLALSVLPYILAVLAYLRAVAVKYRW